MTITTVVFLIIRHDTEIGQGGTTMVTQYSELRSHLKTGDVVLFSGKGGLSAGIKFATGSKWSHVGLVYFLEEYNLMALWESTTLSKFKDIDTGKYNKGVQIVPLSERIRTYDGEVNIRRLNKALSSDHHAQLVELRELYKGKPYELNEIELIKAAFDGPFGANEADISSLFCSELVADAYQKLGILDKTLPANEYTPSDFSSDTEIDLLSGYALEEEIAVAA
ncbi:YiiX/YebB-like N1pC/P60 family cysteine hydrolase [Nitratireductor sp. XY-223]|uniref:YiiX/YebB-like N1pC/P60 family cysteine hydrolase n=1 Tax=Nitratireductor sp. XY-223 TaxID=2561926 RepID=UPI00145B2AD3|nr:YiiX/YebB-like N1pC/P60 family cysteine hydrolase [Nitratireductor sp. XY-223]